ncbi:SGNH/GDSL hydrolase family protein [Bacillus timonensis]|uniref:SGNH/GDSL hydrolase family protein n=1 Tax=Bacillus timonensis TaxID=1033734 RepID=A0A4S3PKH3_9BACI|nr:GDSL-type esterase/lipase family protein [Bacillus timonensis]THE09112.1 SGNH/GDSL hydrolase family protein [Bacillus timonensis]
MKIGLVGDSLTEGRPGVSFVNILKENYSTISFDNLGKPGETVKSLHTRLTKTKLDYDLIFLWIGVNDVYSKLLRVQAQPVANDPEEFREYYNIVLEIVTASSIHVVTVSPALVGETLQNESNKEIKKLSSIIESLSKSHVNVSFLDMHSAFEKHLSKVTSSDYVNIKVMRVMLDVLFYKNPSSIDRISKKRGLHFTLDGIHLNSAGAALVADEYSTMIDRLLFNNHKSIQ